MILVRQNSAGYRWYRPDGFREWLVSTTTALGYVFRFGGWAGFDPWSAAVLTARRRGKAVHRACEILANGHEIAESSLHPIVVPYVAQFRDFMAKTDFRATGTEIEVFSARYRYGGKLDLVGDWDGEAGLLDIKTGLDTWLAGFQTAAYEYAYRETTGDQTPRRRGTLLLSDKAPDKWKLRVCPDPSDFSVFLSALNIFRVAEARGKLTV